MNEATSHPLRVRGLKHNNKKVNQNSIKSHPLRVRGLKLTMKIVKKLMKSRILYGCVD